MRTLAVSVLCLAAAAAAAPHPGLLIQPATSQFHAQDELGQYSYGYSGGPSAKQEVRTLDGVTRGSYSYVDAHGLVQSASYVSDPVHGFRVAATNLPVGPSAPAAPAVIAAPAAALPADTPEVVAAKAAHFAAHAQARAALLVRRRRSPGAVLAAPLAPITVALAPTVRGFGYSTVQTHPTPLHGHVFLA